MAKMQSVQKDKEKNKVNYFKILLARIWGLAGAICFKFGM